MASSKITQCKTHVLNSSWPRSTHKAAKHQVLRSNSHLNTTEEGEQSSPTGPSRGDIIHKHRHTPPRREHTYLPALIFHLSLEDKSLEEGFPLTSSKSVNKMSKLFKKVFLDCVYIKSYRLMGVTARLSIGYRSEKHCLHKAVGEKRNHSMKVE